MNLHLVLVQALLLALAFDHIYPSYSMSVKGSVSCLDCSVHQDLSGVRVAVKCKNDKRLVYTVTNSKGHFKAKMPTMSSSSSPYSLPDCFGMLLGGPKQLCASKQSMISKLTTAGLKRGENSYKMSTPLTFFTKCPSRQSYGDEKIPADSPEPQIPTNNIPMIFLFPFFPIIGIP